MKFELHFIQTFSNEKMAYIRIVYLDELNKLGIQNFSIRDNLGFASLYHAGTTVNFFLMYDPWF